MKPALPWSTAARIAWRELRASRAKFVFVILSVAIGVAALTGVRGFSESFQKTLLDQARSIMAADLSARMFRQPTAREDAAMKALSAQGVQRTAVTEMVSMAAVEGDPVPLLVSLKVVDPSVYPFYGTVQLSPAESLRQALTDSTVVVDENLLVRLRAHIGDRLKIGGEYFRIAAVILKEPDRMTAGIGLGPRVMITREAVEKTGLLQPGSRATERILFKAGDKAGGIGKLRAEVEKTLPDAQVSDFRETSPAITQGLNHATGLLSLICLVAMVLGAIGVAMAMRAHLQQRIEILAIMKSIGARASDILRIYLLQTLFLGIAGALLGVALGLGVEWVFPSVLGKLLPMRPPLRLPVRTVSEAMGTGILTTLLFCLPPLLDIRRIRPSVVLRRTVESGGGAEGTNLFRRILLRLKESKAQWVAGVVIVAALAGIAAELSGSVMVGKWFAGSLCALLVVILALAAVTLRLLRAFLAKTRLHLNSAVRHGLANLYRPGNQSAAVLAALGAGVMLILSVFLMQGDIIRDMRATTAPDTPNVFLVDMGAAELPGIEKLLAQQPEVKGKVETLPVVAARMTEVSGQPAKKIPSYLRRSVSLTWADAPPAGVKVLKGKWWPKSGSGGLAVVDHVAARLHLHLGSRIVFVSGEKTIETRVTAIYKSDGQHVYSRSEFILPPEPLQGLPVVWYGAVHVDPGRIGALETALFNAYPTVTVINIADILETIQGLVAQITIVIRFLAAFSILSGIIILASSVASTRFRRIREVVVLKTLGATRNRVAAVFSVEFIALGLLAGAVGVVFANLLSCVLLHKMDVAFHLSWWVSIVAVVATAVLAVGTGWIASFRLLGQKPLEILREE